MHFVKCACFAFAKLGKATQIRENDGPMRPHNECVLVLCGNTALGTHQGPAIASILGIA